MSDQDPKPAMKIALIVAAARNRVIGLGGTMPWRVPSDLKTFRRLTMGRPIIMGRKTFQSIGGALDGRTNIVITRDAAFQADGVQTATSVEKALSLAAEAPRRANYVMIVGGGEIYRATLAIADILYMTEIAAEPDGDAWFPAIEPTKWREIERTPIERHPRDEYAAELIIYERIH